MPSTQLTRRAVLGSVAAGTAALAGCTGDEPRTDADQQWLQHGCDPTNAAHAPDADGPTDEPSIAWQFDGEFAVQPLLGDALYLNAAGDGCLALDPATGETRWRDGGNYTLETPAIADGTAYLPRHGGVRAVDSDGGIDVLSRRFGYERWSSEGRRLGSPLTIADDRLYAGTGSALHDDAALTAIDADDGAELWSVPVETSVETAPAVADGLVVAVDRSALPPGTEPRSTLAYAVSTKDGEIEWTHEFGATDEVRTNWLADPVAGDGLVYVPTTRGLVVLALDDGTAEWRLDVDGGVMSSPALAGDRLLVGLPSGTLLALDAATGEERWRDERGDWYLDPVVADETVYAVDEESVVRAWTLDGDRRFELALDAASATAPPSVGGGRLYVPTSAALYAVA